MKKILCTLLVLIASVVSAYATDALTAKNVTIQKGGTAVLEIELTNEATSEYGGFEFDLKLPSGITATKIQKAFRLISAEAPYDGQEGFTFLPSIEYNSKTNDYKVIVFNYKRIVIGGTSGTVALITLVADNTVNIGDVLEGEMNEVKIATINAEQTDAANSTFNITISSRTILDENSQAVPAATNGAVDLLVKRTIKANEWSTLCLPFDMDEETTKLVFGDDVKLAEFDRYEKDGDNIKVIFYETDLSQKFYANWPYVIKTSKDITEFELTAAVISNEDEAVAEYQTGSGKNKKTVGSFTGTLHAGTVIPDNYLFLSSNKFYYSVGKTVSKAFRAYFWFKDKVSQDSANSRVTFSIEEKDVTGIKEVMRQEEDKFYNLSGQQVKPEKKGLYIQNGKKKIIK